MQRCVYLCFCGVTRAASGRIHFRLLWTAGDHRIIRQPPPDPACVEAKSCRGFAEPTPPVLTATDANRASAWRHRSGVCRVLRLETSRDDSGEGAEEVKRRAREGFAPLKTTNIDKDEGDAPRTGGSEEECNNNAFIALTHVRRGALAHVHRFAPCIREPVYGFDVKGSLFFIPHILRLSDRKWDTGVASFMSTKSE